MVNLDDDRIPNQVGNQSIDEAISSEGPAANWTGPPIKRMLVPASVSDKCRNHCLQSFTLWPDGLNQPKFLRDKGRIHPFPVPA
ncbi:hypothetical protein ACFVHQ_20210 [Actinomycetes bacterium NPDC127524]